MESLTKSDWFSLIDDYEQSGQSQLEYCNARDIKFTKFGYYRKLYLKSRSDKPSKKISMVPVKINDSSSTSTLKHTVEPDGIYLKHPQGFELRCPSASLESVMKLLKMV